MTPAVTFAVGELHDPPKGGFFYCPEQGSACSGLEKPARRGGEDSPGPHWPSHRPAPGRYVGSCPLRERQRRLETQGDVRDVRTFADPSFFRLIYTLLGEAHPDMRCTKWTHRAVNWTRQRHSFNGMNSSFAIDQYLISKPQPGGWSVLVVKEMWWDGDDKAIRSSQWAKPLSGSRTKILEWLRAEERRIGAQPVPTRTGQ